jgi:hypothetical protein
VAQAFHSFRSETLSVFGFGVTGYPEKASSNKESCYLGWRSSRAVPGNRPVQEIDGTALAGLVHCARGLKANFIWNSVGIARETQLFT